MALCVTPTTSPTFVPSHLVESSPASSIANFADARQYFDTLAALLNRLSAKTAFLVFRIKASYIFYPCLAVYETVPKCLFPDTCRAYNTYTGYYKFL